MSSKYSLVRRDLRQRIEYRYNCPDRMRGLNEYESLGVPCIMVPKDATVEDVIHAFREIRHATLTSAQSAITGRLMREAKDIEAYERAACVLDAVDNVIRKIK